jgi:hypothetical protein
MVSCESCGYIDRESSNLSVISIACVFCAGTLQDSINGMLIAKKYTRVIKYFLIT